MAFLTYGFSTLDVDFAVLLEARSPRSYYGLGFVKKDLAVGTLNIKQILDLPYSKPTHTCVEIFKIILKNVQRLDIAPEYINNVLVAQCGQDAMKLSNQVALDIYQSNGISYLHIESIAQKTKICDSDGKKEGIL